MRRITGFVLRHRLLVVGLWLLATLAGAATLHSTVDRLTKSYSLPGYPSYHVNHQILAKYHGVGVQEPTVPVVTLPAGTSPSSPGVASQLAAVFGAARSVPGVLIADAATTGDSAFTLDHGRVAYALVFTRGGAGQTVGQDDRAVAAAIRKALPPGWHLDVTGLRQLEYSTPATSAPSVAVEGMIGALGALVVLAFVFASFLAVVPLLMALPAVMSTFLLLGVLSRLTDVSFIAEYLVALIGLGVAIDYSLLVVTRWREERAKGVDNRAAVVTAMTHAGRAVAVSGLLVGVGLLALASLPVPFLRSLGYAGLLIPLVSLLVAITLLPVLLDTIGPRLDWPHRRTEATAGRRWTAWAGLVVRHRWVAAAVGVAILAVLVMPLLHIRTGLPRTATLAGSGTAHAGLDTLTSAGVPSGTLTPIPVLLHGAGDAALQHALAALSGVAGLVGPGVAGFTSSGTALWFVLPTSEATQPAGQDVVRAVTEQVHRTPGAVGVGGIGATLRDFDSATYGHFWLLLLLVALVTVVVLAFTLRSVLLPIKAVVVNFASVAAAFGVVVLIWQDGHGSNAIWGIAGTGTITFWVPVFVFAFVFGLSMDYEVFILARVREEYDRTGSTSQAVTGGLARTGRLVSCAALILVFAFLAMSTTSQTDIKILATGLGAGILLDATVVRCLLVPALVALFGRANWWWPGRRPARLHDNRPVAAAVPVTTAT